MAQPWRLPEVNGDDGAWGDILNQFLNKEHYNNDNSGAGDVASGGHMNVTLRPGTASAAPLKFTSGTNLSAITAGVMEYDGTSLFFSPSSTRYNIIMNGLGYANGQTIIGGTGVTDALSLQGTSGNGTSTAAAVQVKVGNNGNILAATYNNDGSYAIGGSGSGVLGGTGMTGRSVINVDNANPLYVEFATRRAENTTAAIGSQIYFGRQRGTLASPSAVVTGDDMYKIYGYGHDGTDYAYSTQIRSTTEGTIANNKIPGVLTFSTADNSSGTITERMRISSTGMITAGNAGTETTGVSISGVNQTAPLYVSDAANGYLDSMILNKHSTTNPAFIMAVRANSNTSTPADVVAGQNILAIQSNGWATSSYYPSAQIDMQVGTGTISPTSMPGRLSFATTANGAIIPTERIAILANGNVGVGPATPTAALHIKAGTTAAGTAPIKLTSGSLTTAAEVGAVEFLTDRLYFTQTTSTTRNTIAAYNDTSGATGDTYYRDSGGNFVRLAIGGTAGQLLTVAGGLPSWATLQDTSRAPRVTTIASSGTPTPNSDTTDLYTITALAATATFGSPTMAVATEGRKLMIRIKDNGTARTLAWNAIYRAGTDIPLPLTTVLSHTMYLGFIYNNTDSKWDLVAITGNI